MKKLSSRSAVMQLPEPLRQRAQEAAESLVRKVPSACVPSTGDALLYLKALRDGLSAARASQ